MYAMHTTASLCHQLFNVYVVHTSYARRVLTYSTPTLYFTGASCIDSECVRFNKAHDYNIHADMLHISKCRSTSTATYTIFTKFSEIPPTTLYVSIALLTLNFSRSTFLYKVPILQLKN